MKKILILFLVAAVLSLSACGSTAAETTTIATTVPQETTATQADPAVTTAAPEVETTAAEPAIQRDIEPAFVEVETFEGNDCVNFVYTYVNNTDGTLFIDEDLEIGTEPGEMGYFLYSMEITEGLSSALVVQNFYNEDGQCAYGTAFTVAIAEENGEWTFESSELYVVSLTEPASLTSGDYLYNSDDIQVVLTAIEQDPINTTSVRISYDLINNSQKTVSLSALAGYCDYSTEAAPGQTTSYYCIADSENVKTSPNGYASVTPTIELYDEDGNGLGACVWNLMVSGDVVDQLNFISEYDDYPLVDDDFVTVTLSSLKLSSESNVARVPITVFNKQDETTTLSGDTEVAPGEYLDMYFNVTINEELVELEFTITDPSDLEMVDKNADGSDTFNCRTYTYRITLQLGVSDPLVDYTVEEGSTFHHYRYN